MNWTDLMLELCRTSPDTFVITHAEANPTYERIDGRCVRVSVDFDTMEETKVIVDENPNDGNPTVVNQTIKYGRTPHFSRFI